MKITPAQYAKALHEALANTSEKDHDKVLDNFVEVLAENNDIKLFDKISEEFDVIEKANKGITVAEVKSASLLSKKTEKTIIESLNEYVKGKVELKKSIDENIIGGVVIKLNDTIIDASIKSNLKDLKNNLSK